MAKITVQRVLIEAQAILNSSSAMKSEERPAYLLAVIAAALINIGDQLEMMPGTRSPL
jgi:hypothetical protein